MKHTSHPSLKIRSSQLMKSLLLGNFKAAFSWKGIEFQDFRSYSYGDDAKYIDWATSSREGTTVIRRYKEEKEAHILCIADMSSSLGFSGKIKEQLLADTIACIWEIALGNGESFWGYKLYDDTHIYIPPRKTPVSLYRFQKPELHTFRDSEKALSLSFLLQYPMKRAVIFVLSDSLQLDIKSFRIAARKHDIIFISLASHFENTLEGAGIFHLRSQTQGFAVDLQDSSKKELYQKKRVLQLQAFRTQLATAGIESMFLDETTPFVKEFLSLMKRREQRHSF